MKQVEPHQVEERTHGPVEPDVLLPSQYFDRVRASREHDPERRLMIAVLETAVNDYLKAAGAGDPHDLELFREVEEWVESRDSSWFFSFENICSVLDLDADYLRGGLHARTQRASRNASPGTSRPPAPVIQDEVEEVRRASA